MFPFQMIYCDEIQAADVLNDERLLAMIRYRESAVPMQDPRVSIIPLTELGGTTTAEVWLSAQPVRTGVTHGVSHVGNDDLLFLQLHLDECAADTLQPLTTLAYQRLLATMRALGYPHLLRVWNYFPAINQECGVLERYRAFCVGRHQVLTAELAEFETHLPAASALGTDAPGLRLYALASRTAGIQIENPRQTSAFRYPSQYGPRSPSFSRAVLQTWGAQQHLYISGTASIVGHASQHHDLMSQLDETLLNLEALLTQANRLTSEPLHPALLKIYCRPDLDPTPLRQRIVHALGAEPPMLFLRADICRQDLLIEIEGLALSPAP